LVRPADEYGDRRSEPKNRSILKPMLIGCGLIALLVFGGLAFLFIFVGRQYFEMSRYAEKMSEEYAALNQQYPFTPPEDSPSIGLDRAASYLRVRGAIMETIPEDLEAKAGNLTQTFDVGMRDLHRLAGEMFQFAKAASQAHVEALKGEQMSPDEFAWVHGQVMNKILNREEGDPKRAIYDTLFKDLEEAAKAREDADIEIEREDYVHELEQAYGEGAEVPEETIAQFEQDSRVGALVDLFAANPDFVEAMQQMQPQP
jgi:hypothetical protein